MRPEVLKLVAKVTKRKSTKTARFQCCDVYQLWENGTVTIDHCVEDEEWGGIEEWQETTDTTDYPPDFFKAGCNRLIDQSGGAREEPL
jgi:hypothetical protein